MAGLLHALTVVGGERSEPLLRAAAQRGLLPPPAATPATPADDPQAGTAPGAELPLAELQRMLTGPAGGDAAAVQAAAAALTEHPELAGPLLDTPGFDPGRRALRPLLPALLGSWALPAAAQLALIQRLADGGGRGPDPDDDRLVPAPAVPAALRPLPRVAPRGDLHGTQLAALAANPALHPDAAAALFARYAGRLVSTAMAESLTDLTEVYADGPRIAGVARTRLLELAAHLRTAGGDRLGESLAALVDGARRRRERHLEVDPVEDGLLRAALRNPHLNAEQLVTLLTCYDTAAAAAAALGCRPLGDDQLVAAALTAPPVLRCRPLPAHTVSWLLQAAADRAPSVAETLTAELLAAGALTADHAPLLPWPVAASGLARLSPTLAQGVPLPLYAAIADVLADALEGADTDRVLTLLCELGGEFTGTVAQFAAVVAAVAAPASATAG